MLKAEIPAAPKGGRREPGRASVRSRGSCGEPRAGEGAFFAERKEGVVISDHASFVECPFVTVIREDLHDTVPAGPTCHCACLQIEAGKQWSGQLDIPPLLEIDAQPAVVVYAVPSDAIAHRLGALDDDTGLSVVGDYIGRPHYVVAGVANVNPNRAAVGCRYRSALIGADVVVADCIVPTTHATYGDSAHHIAADQIVLYHVVGRFNGDTVVEPPLWRRTT